MLFQVVQATWNLLEPSASRALEEAHAEGLGVIVKEGLANGRLTNRNIDARLASLRDYAAGRQATIDQVALGAALARPWCDVVLSGAVTRDQLTSNLRAVDWIESVDAIPDIAEPPAGYWAHRQTLEWA
jgi:aryl-alcohol dehydrogenase-like predicted oxidoreductase